MLLGFKKRFVEPILIGTKVHTIRKPRKIKPKIGETLHMYTGLRTPNCQVISKKEKLISKQKIRIRVCRTRDSFDVEIFVDGRKLQWSEMHKVAEFDGFKDLFDFCNYWLTDEKGKKIKKAGGIMDLYHWTDLKY